MNLTFLTRIALLVLALAQTGGCEGEDNASPVVRPAADAVEVIDEAEGSGMANLALNAGSQGAAQADETDTGAAAGAESALPELPIVSRRWTGDLDELVERRTIRLLTVHGPGRFYLD
ncbi:MAG: hypothetical protein V2I24_16410, partial [Halieaceae bacterium]|nr:hypothetical protein [Halieaceae bacterium]